MEPDPKKRGSAGATGMVAVAFLSLCLASGCEGRLGVSACSGHGRSELEPISGTWVCECDPGFRAEELHCLSEMNPCDGVTCSGQGRCQEASGTAECRCDPGFHADSLNCVSDGGGGGSGAGSNPAQAAPSSPENPCKPGDGVCTPGCTPDSDPDCRCDTLRARLRVSEIALPTKIAVGRTSVLGSWGQFSSTHTVVVSPLPDGESRVGWNAGGGKIHLTPLTAHDQRKGEDLIVQGDYLRDLVAHDGGSTLLVLRGSIAWLVRIGDDGSQKFETQLTGNDQADRMDGIHQGRIAWDGTRYAVYFGIHRGGHEGDKLKLLDASGKIQSGGWLWGCSHSIDVRLAFAGGSLMPICLSDCYPGQGIYFNNRRLVSTERGNCSGGSDARLGGYAALDERMVVAYLSRSGRGNWDVALSQFNRASPQTATPKKWVTQTTANEIKASLAPYGKSQLLLAWATDKDTTFGLLDRDLNPIGQTEALPVKFGPLDDFKSFPNGDVVWGYAWTDLTRLKILRLAYCQ